jgi:outer membrane protein TolC
VKCAALAALLLVACRAVDEDHNAQVERYRFPLDAGVERASEAPVGPVLDVRTSMLLANARNERLGIEGEAYLRALNDRRRQAAAWLPRLDLTPGYFLRDSGPGADNGLDTALVGTYAINPHSIENEQRRARFEARRRLALLYAAQDALLIDVARTHFAVLQSERSRAVLEGSLRLQEARVQDVRARNEVGVARPLDVALSESSLVDARVALINTERGARNGRSLLSFLTGARATEVELVRALELADEARGVDELERLALERRPDLAALLNEVEAASHAIEVAKAQWWPRLSVDLAVFLSRDSQPTDVDWTGLFRVSLPLFEGGRIRADILDAFSFLREAKLRQSLLARSIRRDVEVAHTNLRTGVDRVAALRQQLAAADEAFAQAEALYDAGLATNLERVTAQDQRLRTALSLENAELDLGIFRLDLLRVTGTLHAWLGLERPSVPEGDDAEAR